MFAKKIPSPFSRRKQAFTLVELLAVLTIIGILTALGVGSLTGVQRSTELSTGAGRLIDTFSFSRQGAITSNCPVEVRIYEKDKQITISLYRVTDGGTNFEKFDRTFSLPKSVTISSNTDWSSILSSPKKQDADGEYYSFRFLPNGATNLDGEKGPTLTVIYRKDADQTNLPPNFFTLQLDLQTGLVKTFRPS